MTRLMSRHALGFVRTSMNASKHDCAKKRKFSPSNASPGCRGEGDGELADKTMT